MKVDDLAPKWLGCFWKIYKHLPRIIARQSIVKVFWTWKMAAKSGNRVIKSSNHDQVARSHLDLHKLHHELASHLRRVLRYWWSYCRLSTLTSLWIDVIIPYSAGFFTTVSWSSFWLTLQVIWTSKSFRREIKKKAIYYKFKNMLLSCITFLGSKALKLLIFDITKLRSTRAT